MCGDFGGRVRWTANGGRNVSALKRLIRKRQLGKPTASCSRLLANRYGAQAYAPIQPGFCSPGSASRGR